MSQHVACESKPKLQGWNVVIRSEHDMNVNDPNAVPSMDNHMKTS